MLITGGLPGHVMELDDMKHSNNGLAWFTAYSSGPTMVLFIPVSLRRNIFGRFRDRVVMCDISAKTAWFHSRCVNVACVTWRWCKCYQCRGCLGCVYFSIRTKHTLPIPFSKRPPVTRKFLWFNGMLHRKRISTEYQYRTDKLFTSTERKVYHNNRSSHGPRAETVLRWRYNVQR